jgi:predicted TPR repeat methyltransferase
MIEVLNDKHLPNVTTVTETLTKESLANNDHLQTKFDLIVASSVCSFLPNYEETLLLLKSMLAPGGVFVQWDWLITTKNVQFGFTEERVETAMASVGFTDVSLSIGFSLPGEEMGVFESVLMAVARQQTS